jgi:hypothetical protein
MFQLPYVESVAGVAITVASARAAVQNTSLTPLFDRLLNSTVAAFGFWLAITSIPAMLPVLMDTSMEVVTHVPGSIIVNITATKVQDCDWIDTEAYVLSSNGAVMTRAVILPVFTGSGSSRPVGKNDFGLWMIKYPDAIPAIGVQLKSRHECGHRWPVDTNQGPFYFPALQASANPMPVPSLPDDKRPILPTPPVFPIPQSYSPKLDSTNPYRA